MLYIFGAWRCAIDLRAISPYWILFALAINWVGDIAAFYVGRTFGRHKLVAARQSRKVVGRRGRFHRRRAIVFGVAMQKQFALGHQHSGVVGLSVLCNIAGQLGDLAESALSEAQG